MKCSLLAEQRVTMRTLLSRRKSNYQVSGIMDIEEKSKEIRKYRTLAVIMFVSFPIIVILVSILATSFSIEDKYIFYFAIPYALAYLYVGVKWSYSNCPICKQPMFRKGLLFYGFSRCVNCSYDLKDPSTSQY